MTARFAILNDSLDALLGCNPSASTEALANALSSYFEACVSEVLESIHLPPARVPSPTAAMLRTLVARRRRKTSRQAQEDISERESFVAELYHIRSELDGHAQDGTVPLAFASPNDGCGTLTRLPREYPAADALSEGMAMDGDGLDRTRLGPFARFRRDSGNLSPLGTPPMVRFSLEPQLQELVASDWIFEQVAKVTEQSLRAFALESNVPMELSFGIAKDPEYPHWRRYVITIGTSLDFDSRMSLWSAMDATVRKDLSRLRGATPEDSTRIEGIAGNLFLDMELV